MAFSQHLLDNNREIRSLIARHPFVLGIANGTLRVEKFRFYMRQDYVFLVEYCRIWGLAVAKADNLLTMGKLAQLLHSTLEVEMALHRAYAAEFGISESELESTSAAPTTHAYTRHLLNVAWSGSLAEIVGSLLPCQWGYLELASEMAAEGKATPNNPYRKWIEAYSSPEYCDLARWLRDLFDSLTEGARPEELTKIEKEYAASSRYELMFWDMSWREESWIA